MWSRTGELYSIVKDDKKTQGAIPEETCPRINLLLDFQNFIPEEKRNKFIDLLEGLRTDNSTLRDLGKKWYENAEYICEQGDKIIEEIEKERDEFESENNEYKNKIEILESEIADLVRESQRL